MLKIRKWKRIRVVKYKHIKRGGLVNWGKCGFCSLRKWHGGDVFMETLKRNMVNLGKGLDNM